MTRNRVHPGIIVAVLCALLTGCAATPKESDQDDLVSRARSTRYWFQIHVDGLENQISRSAGYIVFPDVAQWGIVFGGGSFGRGVLFDPKGEQLGWVAINNASVGLQAGVEGFRMLIVLENAAELAEFKAGKWNGSANGIAVAGESGGSVTAPFQDGIAVYQGANRGLMAGVQVALNNIRFEPL